MNKSFYNNKIGYVISIIFVFIFLIFNCLIYNLDDFNPLIKLFGILFWLISISVIISIFKKLKNLGKVVGIVSSIVVPIVIFGNYNNYKLQKERLEFFKTDSITLKKNFEERFKVPDSLLLKYFKILKLEKDSLAENEIDILKKKTIKKLYDFFQAIKEDYRNDIPQNIQQSIIISSDKILLRKLEIFEDFHNENIIVSQKLFNEIENDIKLYNFNSNQQVKVNEFMNSINYIKEKKEMTNIITSKIIFELRNLIKIKRECKLTKTKNTIFFNKEECNKDWNISVEKLENYIIDLDEAKKELIDYK